MKYLRHRRHAQRGATLIITMVMLVLITMLCISTIRTSTVDEKMAGAARDRDKAFQAAEGAVQKCLNQIKLDPTKVNLLTPAASTVKPNWENTWDNSNSVVMTVDALNETGLAEQPRCMYETLGAGSGSYRVTGRARGSSLLTEVILQATYSTE
jgi:type IV pilus assembly protein PilX